MELSDNGVTILKSLEGLRLQAYRDSVGIPTIGWGSTSNVKLGDTITEEEATARLLDDLKPVERYLSQFQLNNNQFDALTIFAFNLGTGMLHPDHTIGAALHNGDMAGVANAFALYNHAGGHVVDGLTRRRAIERRLFNTLVTESDTKGG